MRNDDIDKKIKKVMKILVFTGGLGNQIFEYAFLCHLRSCFPNESFFGHYGKKLKEHYGLEINRWFDVSLPKEKWWVLPMVGLFYFYKQLFPKSKWLDLYQREWKNKDAIVFFPFKFTKQYFPKRQNWLWWKVDEDTLNQKNKELLELIKREETCFVHVRRGDYLSPSFKALFKDCCTAEYYKIAIELMRKKCPQIRFICFSDDLAWLKSNLYVGDDAVFVDWNVGENSPLDMYLMSQCRNGIMANSSFSYWGAYLGAKKKVVIYPLRWWNNNDGNPDIFMNEWIGL